MYGLAPRASNAAGLKLPHLEFQPGRPDSRCNRMPNAPPPTAPSSGNGPPLPAAVRNWLVARYLSDPTPGPVFDNDPEPMVFVRHDTFADYLVSVGYDLLPNLDAWKNAGWIRDVMVDLTPSSDPNASAPYAIARLNLPFGRLRLVGIRQTVLTAPTEPASATGPYAALLSFARADLKGQERAVIDALCDAGGELPIADLAFKAGVGWDDPFQGFKDSQRRLNPKLRPAGWRLERRHNAGCLVTLGGAKVGSKSTHSAPE